MTDLIYRREFKAQDLVANYPPQWEHRNKKIVFEMSSPRGARHSGDISVARWKQMSLPGVLTRGEKSPELELRKDFFTYELDAPERSHWHLNFAHYDLFGFYGGPLFAQDEMQVTEHPALGSVRHALIDSGDQPLTVQNRSATPILIMGVERRCAVATDENPGDGRPYGLYGNNFARASEETIRRATRVIDPPTISNIIAMEAPAYGQGRYTRQQLKFILSTAFTGFRAAVFESRRLVSPEVQTVIHTGYWGCGAYGGNRELTPLLQMIAACCAEADTLVFHTGGDNVGCARGVIKLSEIMPPDVPVKTDDLIDQIESIGYAWGVSDGN